MKNYDKENESSYLTYLDAKNLYGWKMSQKLPINGFVWYNYFEELTEVSVKNYNEDSEIR